MANQQPQADAPRTAAQVCEDFELSAEAARLLNDHLGPAVFFTLLVRERLYADAIRFAAHFLPVREAVWWAALCVRHVGKPAAGAAEAALRAAVAWVQGPGEGSRRAAGDAAEAAGYGSAVGGVAMAAFLSGGSIAPPGQPAVEPKPGLAPQTLAAAVLLASRRPGPAHTEDCRRLFAALAAEVSEGRNRWPPQPAPAAAAH